MPFYLITGTWLHCLLSGHFTIYLSSWECSHFFLVYVDDIIITSSNISVIHLLISKLQQQFPLKDLGSLSFILGTQAHRSSDGLHLSQTKYITDLLHKVKMLGAKPASFPCPSGTRLSRFDGDPLPDPGVYKSVVGALLYCTLTKL